MVFNRAFFFLGLWLIFLSMEVAACGCHGNAVSVCLCWGRAPPSGQRESWGYTLNHISHDENQQAEVSLHLIGLCCSQCFVFTLLHGVSDEPHDQDDEDTPEQCTNHCTSDHSISHFCGLSSFLFFFYQQIFRFLLIFQKKKKKTNKNHTFTQIYSTGWKAKDISSVAQVLPELKLGYVSDFQYTSCGCWGNKSTHVFRDGNNMLQFTSTSHTRRTHFFPAQASWSWSDPVWSRCTLV